MPVLTEMDKAEDAIRKCLHRTETLESLLKRKDMGMEQREELEKELESLKGVLKKHETELESLRKDNRFTALIAVLLMVCSFLFYGIYSMFFKD